MNSYGIQAIYRFEMARALRTLEILQNRPGVTAGELARRLGVSERATRRATRSFVSRVA